MKKLISLLCVVAMLCSFGAVAFAAETDEVVLTIDAADESLYEGVWGVFVDLFAMYLPAEWVELELDEEDIANGYLLAICPEEEDSEAMMIVAFYTPEETGVSSIEEVAEYWTENFGYECMLATINDMPVVLTEDAEDNYGGIVFMTDTGYVFEIGFAEVNNEEYSPIYVNMMCTLVTGEDALNAIYADEYVEIAYEG